MVCSIWPYSVTRPVAAVWKRWFRPGSSRTAKRAFPAFLRAASIAARFSFGVTCRSLLPFSARTGQRTRSRNVRGSDERKKRNQGLSS